MGKQKDLFNPQMEIGDELIDRGLPTHIQPNSSSMDKRKLKFADRSHKNPGEWYILFANGLVVARDPLPSTLIPGTEVTAAEMVRRWNMHEDLMDLCNLVIAGNTEHDRLEAMAEAIIEKHNPTN